MEIEVSEKITFDNLKWPDGWSRTNRPKESEFYTTGGGAAPHLRTYKDKTIAESLELFMTELTRLGVRHNGNVIITNNKITSQKELQNLTEDEPKDTGVAVYFMHEWQICCFPCDTYNRVADNIYALGKVISSLRFVERHNKQMMNVIFEGFRALPDKKDDNCWWKAFKSITQ